MKHPIPIIYEDDFLLAVSKPPRLASVPAEKIPIYQTVLGKIQRQLENQNFTPYLLHRLDYQTSGALLFGKFGRDRTALEGIFKNPGTRKKYIALIKGVPYGKTIVKKLQARASREKIFAQTDYKIIKVFKIPGFLCSLIEAEIETGRRHQIRQHFADIGHPIILDSKYGDIRFNKKFRTNLRLGRQFLHCSEISFIHPIQKNRIQIKSPLPPDLKIVLKRFGYKFS